MVGAPGGTLRVHPHKHDANYRPQKRSRICENAEPVAQPLHTTDETAPAFVSVLDNSSSRKRLPS
jgi:hypothetical protein